jgi:hypothetical protein
MAHFKSYLLAVLDVLGISITQALAWIGLSNLGHHTDLASLQGTWDWVCYIADILRVTAMGVISLAYLIFRFYAEYKKYKKEHAKDNDKPTAN